MVKTKAYFKVKNIHNYYDSYNVTNIKEVYYLNEESTIYITAREFEIENIGYLVSFRWSNSSLFSLIELGILLSKDDYIELIFNNINTLDLIRLNKSYELIWNFYTDNINYLCLMENEHSENMLKSIFDGKPFIRDKIKK